MTAVYLVMHQSKPNVDELTRKLVAAFEKFGIGLCAEPWLVELMGKEAQTLFLPADAAVQAVVSVGGDGTFLRANQAALLYDVPLLGINMGRIGFLAEMEFDHLEEIARRLQKHEYELEERMLLEAALEDGTRITALNDVVVSRGGYARLIPMNVWVGNEFVGRYIADGLIVSSPTGSTGYSLSAGGPIVCPQVDCLVLSPICAHSLQHRPVIAAATQTVIVELDCAPDQKSQLSIDGREAAMPEGKQRVVITSSARRTRFIRMKNTGFFDVIRYKLSEWSGYTHMEP